jgi:hypothetical protein
MTQEVLVPFALQVLDPGLDTTVYPVMALPPSFAGAVHLTTADVLPGVAAIRLGAAGTVTDAEAGGTNTSVASIASASIPTADRTERGPLPNPLDSPMKPLYTQLPADLCMQAAFLR